MLGKAWRWLASRLDNKQQGQRRLRFSVHRHPTYQSFWRPAATPDQAPRLEIQVFLEASNMSADACRITAAEIAGMPAIEAVIGVRDAGTGTFARDNPLPPRQITTLSLHFLVDGQAVSGGDPFSAVLILTDDVGERHPVKVIMH